PHAPEEKEVEFIYAPNGILGLQTAWPVVVKRLLEPGHLKLHEILERMVVAPRRIMRLPVPNLKPGTRANLTLFSTDEEWTYTRENNQSRSRNSPYLGQTLHGKALGIYNKNQFQPA
ncbi:MAG: dihydroorotase, partial [Cyclonatronaceae bacterium]